MAPLDHADHEKLEVRLAISESAVDQYIKNNGSFTLKSIANELDLTVSDIFKYFPGKRAILQFYYASVVYRYQLMIDEIDDFDSYMLGEKLSNFAFASFDMLDERKPFVDSTYSDLILYSNKKTIFEKETEKLLRRFIEDDPLVSSSSTLLLNSYFYSVLRRKYLELIRFRMHDKTEGQELSMELTDKLTGFLQELLYSAVLDKGADLAKFFTANCKTLIKNTPLVTNLLSKIEIR